MTIPSIPNNIIHIGNGSATVFPYNFKVLEAEDIKVSLLDITTLLEIIVLAPAAYTLTGLGSETGGTVIYSPEAGPLPSTQKILIERIVPYDQDADLLNQSGFYPETIEDALDRTVMQTQQLAEASGRALSVPHGEAGFQIDAAAIRATKILGFDADGNPISVASDAANVTADRILAEAAAEAAALDAIQTALDRTAAGVSAAAASGSASSALISSVLADADRIATEDARDMVLAVLGAPPANIYPDIATGNAAVANGAYFWVCTGSGAPLELYRRVSAGSGVPTNNTLIYTFYTLADLNAAIAEAHALIDAALSAIIPVGGSVKFPYDNNSQFPAQTPNVVIPDVGVRGFFTQSFGNRSTPVLKFTNPSCHYSKFEKDDALYPAVTMYLEGATLSTENSGLGWNLIYFPDAFGTSEALFKQRRRFRWYVNTGNGAPTNFLVYSRQVPLSWRRVGVSRHHEGTTWWVNVHNIDTGEVLVGTGTDDATFLAELAITSTSTGITQHATSGTTPSMFGIGAVIVNDNLTRTLVQPATESYSMMAHGLSFYAEEAVTTGDIQAINNGAHPSTVITASTIKWLRKPTLASASWAADPLATGDTTVAMVPHGSYQAGSNIGYLGSGTATIDHAPRNRYVYGLKPGEGHAWRDISGRCWPTIDSHVELRIRSRSGEVLADWFVVSYCEVAGSWTGYTNLIGGSGGATGTFALGITGDGTGATGRFTVTTNPPNPITAIFIDNPGSGYTTMTFDFSASAGLTGASATPTLAPIDTSHWTGRLRMDPHERFPVYEIRLRGRTGELTGPVWMDASDWGAGLKIGVVGQSQAANGASATGEVILYRGDVQAALVMPGANNYNFNKNPRSAWQVAGRRVGADQYQAMATMLALHARMPVEVVLIAQGGTSPIDLMENMLLANFHAGMWDSAVVMADTGGSGGADYSGAVMLWWTDVADEGGLFGDKVMDGMWNGQGDYAYSCGDHFYGSATFVGTTMTVTAIERGPPLAVGDTIRVFHDTDSSQTPLDTTITAFGTGTGGLGTYTLSAACTPGDPTREVTIIGLHEDVAVDAVGIGYITSATLTVQSLSFGTIQAGDRIIVTSGAVQTNPQSFVREYGTGSTSGVGGIGTYTLSSGPTAGSSGSPVTFKAIRGHRRIRRVMDLFAPGTPILLFPPTRQNTTSGPYVEGVQGGGIGASRDSGRAWAEMNGLQVGIDFSDLTMPDAYHPDNTATGKSRLGYEMGLSAAKCLGLVTIGEPNPMASSFKFMDGTRTFFRFRISLPNNGMLASGDGTGIVTPCVELSLNGTTWVRDKHIAHVNANGEGSLPFDVVEVEITDAAYRVASLKVQVLANGPFSYGTGAQGIIDANDAAINGMIYEAFAILPDIPGICVVPSQTIYTVSDA